jgi:hypothetical protein
VLLYVNNTPLALSRNYDGIDGISHTGCPSKKPGEINSTGIRYLAAVPAVQKNGL